MIKSDINFEHDDRRTTTTADDHDDKKNQDPDQSSNMMIQYLQRSLSFPEDSTAAGGVLPLLPSSSRNNDDNNNYPTVLPPRSRCLSADAALETAPMQHDPAYAAVDATYTAGTAVGGRVRSSRRQRSNNNNNNREEETDASDHQEDWIVDLGLFQTSHSKGGTDDDDEDSVDYYDRTDFLQTHWDRAMEHFPPVGFAVVGAGFFLFHPFIFMAGALTAFSTVHAGRTIHDCMPDTSIFKVFGDDEDEVPSNQAEEQRTRKTSSQENNSKRTDQALIVEGSESAEEKKSDQSRISEVTYTVTEDESSRNIHNRLDVEHSSQHNLQHVATVPLDALEQTSLFQTNPSTLDTPKALQWVEQHYPPLQTAVKLNQTFEGLNAIDFFNVFFANDAPYNFQEFQKQRKDKDIEYGKWETLQHITQTSLHHKAANCKDLNLGDLFQERVLKFDAKTNAFLGPPYAPTTKIQRALVASKHLLVLESKTRVSDIPFSDRFFVMERWIITADKVNDKYVSSLSIYSEVFFTNSCPFESKIISTSKQTFSEIATQWCKMAQEALKLSEEHRTLRIQRSLDAPSPPKGRKHNREADDSSNENINSTGDDIHDAECIEIQHLDGGRSWVVGEGDRDLILARTSNVVASRRRLGSFQRVGKSIHRIVRRRTNTQSSSMEKRLPPSISSPSLSSEAL